MRQQGLLITSWTLAVAVAAAPLAAQQSPGSFEMYVQRMEGTSSPLFYGISLSRYARSFGLRLGGALNFRRDAGETQYVNEEVCNNGQCQEVAVPVSGGSAPLSVGGWTADADLIFEPLRRVEWARSLLLGFSPYGFGGVGGSSIRPGGVADTTRATWSVGAGVRHSLIGKLGLSAEARYRYPFSSDSQPTTANLQQHMEYRVSVTVGFGRRKKEKGTPAVVAAGPPVSNVPLPTGPASARIVPRVLDEADGYVDAPYRRGGASPYGFDAPGFVQYLYAQQGVTLPRTTRELAVTGTEVSTRIGSLRRGDLLFFANDGTNADHVAIYAGRSRIIHASASGGGVRYDVIGEGDRGEWFADHLVAVRRIVNDDAFGGEPEPTVDPTGQPDHAPPPRGGDR